ncbi:hypothetical protein [Candidatus Desulfosporosinus nitrosoreducens]|uniref:hypothetical protein n=1 Tax=Candidatus Desulfosporosinus nitrosoreducens TaxID=3401928 RepID=UPI00280BB98E|nr:hypothetical protein [Desulfosporosinus sp. PR]
MRTPSLIRDFVTMLLINDLNMQTVELRNGITRIDDVDKRFPVIEITFEDVSKSNWFDILNAKLRDFLQGQEFLISNGDDNNMFVFLL